MWRPGVAGLPYVVRACARAAWRPPLAADGLLLTIAKALFERPYKR